MIRGQTIDNNDQNQIMAALFTDQTAGPIKHNLGEYVNTINKSILFQDNKREESELDIQNTRNKKKKIRADQRQEGDGAMTQASYPNDQASHSGTAQQKPQNPTRPNFQIISSLYEWYSLAK